jgi:hypothetical protein
MKIAKFFENVNQFKEGNFKAVEVIEVKEDEIAFLAKGGKVKANQFSKDILKLNKGDVFSIGLEGGKGAYPYVFDDYIEKDGQVVLRVVTFPTLKFGEPTREKSYEYLYPKNIRQDSVNVFTREKIANTLFSLQNNDYGMSKLPRMNVYDNKGKEIDSFGSMMAKGGAISKTTYVSNRNIDKVDFRLNNDSKSVKGKDLLDGVYVKNTAIKNPRAKFDAREIAEKLADMSYRVWDKLNIESGSQIYASKTLQPKLAKFFNQVGIDETYRKLTPKQRIQVSKILTDENQHSLNNYLALRGYRGEEEYQGYVRMFEMNKKRPYVLNPSNIERLMAEGGEIKKGDMVIVDNPYWKLEAPFKAVKRKVKAVFGDDIFFTGGSTSDIKYVKKYEDGGELDQGFNDRLDESMGNRDGKEAKMEATLKDRRNESKGENKAVGKRPYSSVHTMDKMAEGGELGNINLPHNLKKYFTKPVGTIEVEMNKLIPIRAREKGIANAERYMRLAYDGKMERRKPITIYKSRNGKYRIKDGNSTFAVAKKHNWKTIWAEVVENPNISKRKENSIFTVASKIRKDGESWASAVKRAGAMKK